MKDRIILKKTKTERGTDCTGCYVYNPEVVEDWLAPICDDCDVGYIYIEDTVPKYETPEQYKIRTGKEYPDDAPVWVWSSIQVNPDHSYALTIFKHYKPAKMLQMGIGEIYAVIANEAGKPPTDYKPEEV